MVLDGIMGRREFTQRVCRSQTGKLASERPPPPLPRANTEPKHAPRTTPRFATPGGRPPKVLPTGLRRPDAPADKTCFRQEGDHAQGWFRLQASFGSAKPNMHCIAVHNFRGGTHFKCGQRVIEVELGGMIRTTLIGEPVFPAPIAVTVREWQAEEGNGIHVTSEEDRGPIKRGDLLFAASSGPAAAPSDRRDFFMPLEIFALHEDSGVTFSYRGKRTAVESEADCIGADRQLYYLVMGASFIAYSIHLPLEPGQ